jgi:hypothetical protein
MIMPSMVSPDRSLLADSALSAIRKFSPRFMLVGPVVAWSCSQVVDFGKQVLYSSLITCFHVYLFTYLPHVATLRLIHNFAGKLEFSKQRILKIFDKQGK